MTLEYGLFIAEAEGLLDTRESKIQRIIKAVRNYPDAVMPNLVFYSICKENGIEPGTLTRAEMSRITTAIR